MTRPSRDDGSTADPSGRSGLSLAVRQVLADNHDRFLGFVRRQVGSRHVAEEVLHDAIVRAMARGETVRDRNAIVPWFYRLLRNAIVDHLRSVSAERRGLSALAREIGPSPEATLGGRSTDTICDCVSNLVAVLNTNYATALRRVELDGEPLGRYARAAGISQGNASVRLHRARQALRRAVDEHCGSCVEHGGYLCECRTEPHAAARRPRRRSGGLPPAAAHGSDERGWSCGGARDGR